MGSVAPAKIGGNRKPVPGPDDRAYIHARMEAEAHVAPHGHWKTSTKLKHLLRKAQERSRERTWNRIGQLLTLFPPDECQNYIANAG